MKPTIIESVCKYCTSRDINNIGLVDSNLTS